MTHAVIPWTCAEMNRMVTAKLHATAAAKGLHVGGYSIFSHAQRGFAGGVPPGLRPDETPVILSPSVHVTVINRMKSEDELDERVIAALDKKGNVTLVIDNEPLPPGAVLVPDDSVRLKTKRERGWAVEAGLGLGPKFT